MREKDGLIHKLNSLLILRATILTDERVFLDTDKQELFLRESHPKNEKNCKYRKSLFHLIRTPMKLRKNKWIRRKRF